jgi:hypothetical protein
MIIIKKTNKQIVCTGLRLSTRTETRNKTSVAESRLPLIQADTRSAVHEATLTKDMVVIVSLFALLQ